MKKVAIMKTGSSEKRRRRIEKAAMGEKLTNGYMLCLTYGLAGIILLEIVRRHHLMGALTFANMFCMVCGVLFAIAAAVIAILGAFNKISKGRTVTHTIMFVVSSLIAFFLSWDIRLFISRKLYAPVIGESDVDFGILDFLANPEIYDDAKYIEFAVIAFLVVAFVVYAVRLARLEKNK